MVDNGFKIKPVKHELSRFQILLSLCNPPIRSDSEDHLKIIEFVGSDMTVHSRMNWP